MVGEEGAPQGGMKMRNEQQERARIPERFQSILPHFSQGQQKALTGFFQSSAASGASKEQVVSQFESSASPALASARQQLVRLFPGAENFNAFIDSGIAHAEEALEKAKEVGAPVLTAPSAVEAGQRHGEEAAARVEPKEVPKKGAKPKKGKKGGAKKQEAPEPELVAPLTYAQRVVPVISELGLKFKSVEEKFEFLAVSQKNIERLDEHTGFLEGEGLKAILREEYSAWRSSKEGTKLAMK